VTIDDRYQIWAAIFFSQAIIMSYFVGVWAKFAESQEGVGDTNIF
jgi:hypothetical protein